MAVVQSYNDLISRALSSAAGGFALQQPIWGEIQAATASLGGNNQNMQRVGWSKALPSPLPTGVSAYILTRAVLCTSTTNQAAFVLCKLINMGSLDISGASGTFTDGSAFPTVTELNQSRQISGPVYVEVEVALNVTPGSFTITYVDQDGNTAETTAAQALTASAAVHSSGFVVLNSGDVGARDITAAARSGGTTPTGTLRFWGVVPVGVFHRLTTATPAVLNLITSNFNPIRLGAGDELGVFSFALTSTHAVLGGVFLVGDST